MGELRDDGGIAEPKQVDPCMGCGEETAVGTALYPGRHESALEDGTRLLLCDECYAKARAAQGGKALTDSDMRAIAGNGLMMGAAFLGQSGI